MKVFRKRYLFIILLVVLTIPIAINFVANHYVTESPAEFSAWLGFGEVIQVVFYRDLLL